VFRGSEKYEQINKLASILKTMNKEKKIFVSYNWDDSQVVDEIDDFFLSIGLPIIRDKKELQYKSSIKEFMKKIRDTDYVIMIISDSFLKSANCMYEVLELVKDQSYKTRTLQILLPNAKIFSPSDIFNYIEYWKNEFNNLHTKIEKIDIPDGNVLVKELKHIGNIKSSIGEFLEFLTDENSLSFETIKASNYEQLTDIIGFKPFQNTNRPVSINSDVYLFEIEKDRWIAFIGKIDNKPYEIYVGKEGDWAFPEFENIDKNQSVKLVLDQYDKESGRIDLKYTNIKDSYLYTHEGINRVFESGEGSNYARIIGSLLQANANIKIILNALDEMYVREYDNPYQWKDEIKKILLNYL